MKKKPVRCNQEEILAYIRTLPVPKSKQERTALVIHIQHQTKQSLRTAQKHVEKVLGTSWKATKADVTPAFFKSPYSPYAPPYNAPVQPLEVPLPSGKVPIADTHQKKYGSFDPLKPDPIKRPKASDAKTAKPSEEPKTESFSPPANDVFQEEVWGLVRKSVDFVFQKLRMLEDSVRHMRRELDAMQGAKTVKYIDDAAAREETKAAFLEWAAFNHPGKFGDAYRECLRTSQSNAFRYVGLRKPDKKDKEETHYRNATAAQCYKMLDFYRLRTNSTIFIVAQSKLIAR